MDTVQDLAENKTLFGIIRDWPAKSGSSAYARITPEEQKVCKRLARTLWKRGPMTTGQLAGYVRLPVQDELFQKALAAMVGWKIIEVTKRPWGIAYVAELVAETTVSGSYYAADLVRDRQLEGLPAVEEE